MEKTIKSAVSEQHVTESKEEKLLDYLITESKVENLLEYMMTPDTTESDFYFEEKGLNLFIYMFGKYRIAINFCDSSRDCFLPEEGCGYDKSDLLYAYSILCNRDKIIEIWNS